MRFVVDMVSDAGGRVTGQVATAGEPPAPFSGWLELLRLLEDRAERQTARDEPAPPVGDET